MGSVVPVEEHSGDRNPNDNRDRIEEILHDQTWTQVFKSSSILDKIPPEILHQVLSYLSARDLARVSATCRVLAEHGADDRLWAELVNSHLPSSIQEPGPFISFRRLYLAHLAYWFIPQHKIWFADNEHTGNLILARYDNRRGVIEGYRLIADRGSPRLHIWQSNPDVMIQSFDPKVGLWLDDPVLFLKDQDPTDPIAPCQTWSEERRMPMAAEAQHVFSSLLLCPKGTPQPEDHEENAMKKDSLWPPLSIPSSIRIRRELSALEIPDPKSLFDASELAFRIRRWANLRMVLSPGHNEAVATYATLDPSLYVPTKEKPYQGIWVGDYSAHGCEFLLFIQRDKEDVAEDQDADQAEQDGASGLVHQGSLEAVKLTGDPNVPRGATSFIAEDIGPKGLARVDPKEPFENARIVRCSGHVAGIGFQDDSFIKSQLILISPDYIAHYWQEMGHVSYFRRVDIDSLIQT
ncbi:hypothetical protein N7478_010396 [Penicillium angulare]|uniref:uncharacterized protein n=1 Tax=Penicillium angulare TaxID=116970 RepID=UPI00254044B9|nr:uncharacterized protein N7478_010396 [Penicillium angulare]KAJ5267588.1 hypothetical protein N7478_010396 [Penicillium angulare]